MYVRMCVWVNKCMSVHACIVFVGAIERDEDRREEEGRREINAHRTFQF